ncbi:NAD(P)-dependent alcohol dehydrogenase [Abyssibius alkaniclasticus]|uniref:NAD(P)-dependent alcohol dehydrogenase n=1 Tax=Abyssibius alkaniclasticus TaxID=2881234 RepID=UPI0040583572|tara:strand:- start:57 stop:1031 length:975 start_codon:yes stop_codon:yes gene_type:complete
MKAAVYHKYGPPESVRVEEVPTPTAKAGDVLIRIRATTISTADWRARALILPKGYGPMGRLAFGVFAPRCKVLGLSFAGDIVALGKGVTRFKVGDAVFGFSGMFKFGCHAEFIALRANGHILPKPESLSYAVAASLSFGGTTALYFLRDKANVQPGERVVVVGASGTVGSACVQIAKHFGANVTGVCSARNAAHVLALGADEVIDYQTEDLTKRRQTWDILVDCVGSTSFATHKHLLAAGGRHCLVLSSLGEALRAIFSRQPDGRRAISGTGGESNAALQLLADLAVSGAVVPPIDSEYPLHDIVAAHRRVDSGRKCGAVVVLP